jgi:hypothetical protein
VQTGSALWLDALEQEAELLRRRIGVSTLSLSWLNAETQELQTVVNVGSLHERAEVRPETEVYSLALYPTAASGLRRRHPYLAGPDDACDRRLLELGHRLGKQTQAGAPLIIGDAVWGEFWVASVPGDLPLRRSELPLVTWAAETFADEMADLLARAQPAWGAQLRRWYEIWTAPGNWERRFAPGPRLLRHWSGGFGTYEGFLSQDELHETLDRMRRLGGPLLAVRREDHPFLEPPERCMLGRREYELRYGGDLCDEPLRRLYDVDSACEHGATVIRGIYGQTVLHAVLAWVRRMGGELISITCR